MIDILLAFDDLDEDMGAFNRGCLDDYNDFFNKHKRIHNISLIKGAYLNDLYIQMRTESLSKFIFVAYSHGEHNCLFSSKHGNYISMNTNCNCFTNSFFYTVSCYSGGELGKYLIDGGCTSFFGYNSQFNFWVGYKSFSTCANFGFFLFLNGTETDLVYKEMIKEYNNHIDKVREEDTFIASLLMENRDALVHHGENMTIESLI